MKVMKIDFMRIFRMLMLAAVLFAAASCTEISDVPYTEVEKRSFTAWMANHHPELMGNYQEDGEYYVEVLAVGNPDSVALKDLLVENETSGSDDDEDAGEPGCWISFTLTGRDLDGKVCITRDELMARMQGTFTKFTHYVPYLRYLGATNTSLVEGSYLAMKNTITLSREYAESIGLSGTEFAVRYGTKLRLYMPSSISGGSGMVGDGGYEGEFTLDGTRPVIMDIEITDRINNPVSYEAYKVDGFALAHGGLSPLKEIVDDDEEGDGDDADSDEEDDEEEEEEDDGMYWRHACDTIQGLVVTKRYSPGDLKFNYAFDFTMDADEETGEGGKTVTNTVYRDTDVYADINALEEKINEALTERFGEGVFDGEKVGTEGSVNIWYITRLMDGFIIDSNIAEVRELVFGAGEASGSVMSYSPESDKDNTVTSWYYTVPHMRYGGWYTVVTTSTFAYGYSGRSGSSSTSGSSLGYYYNPYFMYNNYYNSFYGSSYYDYYYYNMYNNYYNSMYYNTGSTSETTTTISSEVQPYAPLIFQLYLEAKK